MRAIYVCYIEYVEKALEAERRLKKGDRQKRCRLCKLYFWPEELRGHACSKAPEPVRALGRLPKGKR